MKTRTTGLGLFLSIGILKMPKLDAFGTTNQTLIDETPDDLLEGDIKMDWGSISRLYGEEFALAQGLTPPPDIGLRGSTDAHGLWKDDWREKSERWRINVYIDPAYSDGDVKIIKRAMRHLKNKSGSVAFKRLKAKPTNGKPFINIKKDSGCWSWVGRTRRAETLTGQIVSLKDGCVKFGTVVHELLHALGFYHEQSRSDRDQFITINYHNVEKGREYNFDKVTAINSLGTDYDYGSIMHYNEYSFSKSKAGGLKTIDARGNSIGQRIKTSSTDIHQLRLMYQCDRNKGIRTVQQEKSDGCTYSCKCVKNQKGCGIGKWGDNDHYCKGNLRCVENKCVKPKPNP